MLLAIPTEASACMCFYLLITIIVTLNYLCYGERMCHFVDDLGAFVESDLSSSATATHFKCPRKWHRLVPIHACA